MNFFLRMKFNVKVMCTNFSFQFHKVTVLSTKNHNSNKTSVHYSCNTSLAICFRTKFNVIVQSAKNYDSNRKSHYVPTLILALNSN